MDKALLLGFDCRSFSSHAEAKFSWMIRFFQARTEGYWNSMEQLFCMSMFLILVSGSAEAEGNGRFHQRPQYNRDRFLRRQQTLYTLHQQGLMVFLVFANLAVMIDSLCAKQEARALQKKNRRSKNMRWIQHDTAEKYRGMLCFPWFSWEGCGDPRNIGQPEE